ncbi:hypothetical protein [Streptomyces sp. H39-S7]|uniref:hypothetical protein n=1 Tax=Streptomyces sp. H39-S7 TaxID=3004357 RepID=UPI0022AF1871|nr:hypothetical protein [Streptomyces sp. H39-S7]MCZ4123022.1 hypothetical protein [Streptomyces sp. H39-S7]
MLRRKGHLLRLLLAGIVLAGAFTVFVATRSSNGERSVADCPDTAMTCPGQSAPPDDAVPPTKPGTTVPGAGSGTPVPLPTVRPPTTGSTSGGTGQPPASGPCASAAACGFPDARTTGPRTAIAAHNTGAMTVKTDGMVIKGWNITGSLDVYANNVTIIDTKITSDNWWGINLRPGFSGLRVLHSEITAVPGKGPDNGGVDYAVSNMGESSVEVGWNDISVFGNALSMGQGNLHDNYVHDIVPFRNLGGEWQHTDAVISGGGNKGQLIIRHNTLLNATSAEQGASASIGLFADTGVVSNTVVDGNWIAGGAYALYGGNKGATGIKVTNNVFSTQFHPKCGVYGPVTAWNAGGAGNVWSNNRMSTGVPVAAGSLV